MAKKAKKKGAMKGCGIRNGCKSKSGGLTAKAGQMKKFPKAAKDPNSRLRKARRKWKC